MNNDFFEKIRKRVEAAKKATATKKFQRRSKIGKQEKIINGYKKLLRAIFTERLAPAKISTEIPDKELRSRCNQVLETLTPRERKAIRLLFGLEDGVMRNLEEVGREFHVTRERIHQIKSKALRKLRHPSRSHHLKEFIIPPTPEELEKIRKQEQEMTARMEERRILLGLLEIAMYRYHHTEATERTAWHALCNGDVDTLPRLREAQKTGQIKQIRGIGPKGMALIQDVLQIAEERSPE